MNMVLNFAQETPVRKHLDALVQDLWSHWAIVNFLQRTCVKW